MNSPEDNPALARPGEREAFERRVPLTSTQEAMLLNTLRHPGRGFEVQQIVIHLEPGIDVLRLRDAWEYVVHRHAVLRGRFLWETGTHPVLEVLHKVDLVFDIRTVNRLDEFLESDRAYGIHIGTAPAFRLTLIELPEEQAALIFTFHHAILDGRSQRIVIEEVFRRYDEGAHYNPDPPPEFHRHCEALAVRDKEPEKKYFTELLDGVDVCSLPRPIRYWAESSLHDEVTASVIVPADASPIPNNPASLASIVQAAWAAVLSTYCRTDDVVFGVTRNGRHQVEGAAGMVGCLINSVPARVHIDGFASLSDLARQVHESGQAVRLYEQASLSEIQGRLRLDRPAFDTMIVFERYTLNSAMRALGGKFAARTFAIFERSSFPIVLAAYQEGDRLNLNLEFDSTKWSSPYMQAILHRFVVALRCFLTDPTQRIGDLDLALPGEIDSIIAASRGALAPTGINMLAGEAVNLIAHQHPSHVAYEDASGLCYSFAQIAERRDQIANTIRRLGVTDGARIAFCANRSFDLVALQLAILECGWTSVPLDPAWPSARLDSVLSAVQAQILVHDIQASGRIALLKRDFAGSRDLRFLLLDEAGTDATLSPAEGKLIPLTADSGTDTAYIMFTSGSSGFPKGVLVSQQALAAHARGAIHAYSLSSSDRVLQFTSPAFDVALEEILPTLMVGGAVVERTEEIAGDIRAFLNFIEIRKVTILNLPSAFFHELVLFLVETAVAFPACVRLVVIGSEKPTLWSVQTFLDRLPRVQLINAYGATETTITSISCDISELNSRGARLSDLPIGRPFGQSRIFVLDKALKPCPIGVFGEICISGPQLAIGYLNAPDRAAKKFAPGPFDAGRMYRTGDMGRLTEDGIFEFHGRLDEQIKIRGVRVEPAEVERAIGSFAGINEAVVITRDAGRGIELVAFVAAKTTAPPLDMQALKDALAAALPAAFIPSEIRLTDNLPRRSNGKIDRQALQQIAANPSGNRLTIEPPNGDLETWIFDIFSRLLAREDIDVNDGFFDIGGHSLLAVRLLAELHRVSKKPLPLAAVFSVTSIRALARLINSNAGVDLPPVIALNKRASAQIHPNATSAPSREDSVPLFCVCGVHLYAKLARSLNLEMPVYGVYLPEEGDLAAGKRVEINVAQIAAAYVSALKAFRPHGPYVIGGLSFGGMLAYEMAQQMSRAGDSVELVVLLDCILPRAFRFHSLILRAKLGLRKTAYKMSRMLAVFDRVRSLIAGVFSRHSNPSSIFDADTLRDITFRIAAENYDRIIEPYSGRVMIFRSSRPPVSKGETIDWDLGWTGLVGHKTPVFGVEGDHLGILVEPGVSEIAKILTQHRR